MYCKSNGVKFGGFDVYDEKSLTSLTITFRPTNCGKQQNIRLAVEPSTDDDDKRIIEKIEPTGNYYALLIGNSNYEKCV